MATQHYINETTLKLVGFDPKDGSIPCRIPQPDESWDIVTHAWKINEAKQLQSQGQSIADAMQAHMDTTAKSFGFHAGMDRAANYLGSKKVKFANDAIILTDWRDNWWEYAEIEEQKVKDGLRTMPTVEEMFVELEVVDPTPVKV